MNYNWDTYFNMLYTYWSKRCMTGDTDEEIMESKIDEYQEMNRYELKCECMLLGLVRDDVDKDSWAIEFDD